MNFRLLPATALLLGLTVAAEASAETTGPPPPTVYFVEPTDLTEYESAPVTIDVVTDAFAYEEQVMELGLVVDGENHMTVCEVGPCTFEDVTLELGEHVLTATMTTDISSYKREITVYVGVPAPEPMDTDSDTETNGSDTDTDGGSDGSTTDASTTDASTTDASTTDASTTDAATDGATSSDSEGGFTDEVEEKGCASCSAGDGSPALALVPLLLGLFALPRRRR